MGGQELLVRGYTKDQFGGSRDLMFRLREVENQKFQRRNADLLTTVKVSLKDALLGFSIPIEHLDGKEVWIKTKVGEVIGFQDVLVVSGQGTVLTDTSQHS